MENAGYRQGMLSSLRRGIASLPPERQMFFLHPADIAGVAADTPGRLWRRYAESGGPLFYPVYAGERGHPILVSAAIGREVLRGDWPDGFRGLLGRYRGEEVAVPDPHILRDMDTPEEYRELAAACPRWDPLAFVADLLARAPLPPQLQAHCDRVAAAASAWQRALNRRGHSFDGAAVYAAGRVHDLAKGNGATPPSPKGGSSPSASRNWRFLSAPIWDGIDPKKSWPKRIYFFSPIRWSWGIVSSASPAVSPPLMNASAICRPCGNGKRRPGPLRPKSPPAASMPKKPPPPRRNPPETARPIPDHLDDPNKRPKRIWRRYAANGHLTVERRSF